MEKFIKIKPIINKKNGQINLCLPKKKLSKDILKEIKKKGSIKIKFGRII